MKINRNINLLILILISKISFSQNVVVNSDGTHSTLVNNILINSDGSHSAISNNSVINSDGTNSTIVNDIIVDSKGNHSVIINNANIISEKLKSSSDTILSNKEILKLREDLTLIKKSDQNLRKLFTNISQEKRKEILSEFNISEEEFKLRDGEIMKEYDSINLKKVETIISKYGYPTKKNVGNELSNVVWLVIQHSDLKIIEKYFPIIKKANRKGDLEDKYIALMKDRMLMYQGKEQIYGTQIAGRMFINPNTNEELGFKYFIWPLKNKTKINELRKSVGIEQTIEELAKSMDIETTAINYSIKEINKISKEIN